MSDLERYYRILELEPGATLEEVNQAYKDLVFVWHPDRIPKENLRLQQKAQDKLKAINEAREKLRSLKTKHQTTSNSPSTSPFERAVARHFRTPSRAPFPTPRRHAVRRAGGKSSDLPAERNGGEISC